MRRSHVDDRVVPQLQLVLVEADRAVVASVRLRSGRITWPGSGSSVVVRMFVLRPPAGDNR